MSTLIGIENLFDFNHIIIQLNIVEQHWIEQYKHNNIYIEMQNI